MRVLLDESLPRQLAGHLGDHVVATVHSQGWSGMTNGALLRAAAREGFDVMVTADQGIEFQQNLRNSGVGVVVVRAASNRMEHLLPLAGQIGAAVPTPLARNDMWVEARNLRSCLTVSTLLAPATSPRTPAPAPRCSLLRLTHQSRAA